MLSGPALLLNAASVPATGFIIRRVGAVQYGQWATAAALISTVSTFAALGLRPPFVRDVARGSRPLRVLLEEQLAIRGMASFLGVVITVVAAAALYGSSTVFKCCLVASFGMLLATICSTLGDLLQGMERFSRAATASTMAGIVVTATTVVVAGSGAGAVRLSIAYLAMPVCQLIILIAFVRRLGISVAVREMLRIRLKPLWSSRQFAWQQIVGIFENNAVGLMLPRMVGAAAFGTFSAGALLADRLLIIPDAVGSIVFPLVTRLAAAGEHSRAAKRAWQGALAGALLCTLIAFALTCLSGAIAHVLFPKAPTECRLVLATTVWGLPFAGASYAMSYSLMAMGLEARLTRLSIQGAVINLIIAVALFCLLGLPGASWFFVLRSVTRTCLLLPSFARTFGIGRHVASKGQAEDGGGAVPNEVAAQASHATPMAMANESTLVGA